MADPWRWAAFLVNCGTGMSVTVATVSWMHIPFSNLGSALSCSVWRQRGKSGPLFGSVPKQQQDAMTS